MPASAANRSFWPALRISDGAIEALKWLGLLLMTADHVNKYLFNETHPWLFRIGRLAMPIFAFVLGANLARPGALARGIFKRAASRLIVFGSLACIPFIALGGVLHHWWPLNILWMMLGVVLVVWLGEIGTPKSIAASMLVLVVFGSSVEFWWPAMFFSLAVYWYGKQPGWPAASLAVWSLACLVLINGNHWAMAALPCIYLVTRIPWRLPRLRWMFYAYYPLHLAALWLIRIPMARAGHLFFT